MNRILLATIILLLSTPIFASIKCYVGNADPYTETPGFDKVTVNNVVTKGGLSNGLPCPSSYHCCTENLCNGAKMNRVSLLLASIMAVFALFNSI